MKKGMFFVISAPSGAGKTTVIKRLTHELPNSVLSVSVTTRGPRKGETEGVDYYFISATRFEEMIKNNELLEWADVHGHLYGTPKAPVEKWIKNGKIILLDIDVQGGKNIKKTFKDAVLIFLMPPSKEELAKRLALRGTDKPEDLKLRLKNAESEISAKAFYDYRIVNDDLDITVDAVKKIILKCSG
jgi:guanylate kinase